MKLLVNHKLVGDQADAHAMVEMILNTTDFEAWFVRARFTELGNLANYSNITLLEKMFRNQQYRFAWYVVKKPFYKVFSKSVGNTEGNIIKTYKHHFDKMTAAQKAGYLAHEIAHIMGFTHSKDKSKIQSKSVPFQIEEYVHAAVAHYKKANE